MWMIIFKGEVLEGFAQQAVKENGMRLFRLSDQEADRLFTGQTLTLKKGLSRQQGESYLNALNKNGLKVYLQVEASLKAATPLSMSLVDTETKIEPLNVGDNSAPLPPDFFSTGDASQQNSYTDADPPWTGQTENAGKTIFERISLKGRMSPMIYLIQSLSLMVGLYLVSFSAWIFLFAVLILTPFYLLFLRVQILRLHDTNLSGYWVLLFPVVNIITALIILPAGFETHIVSHHLFYSLFASVVPWTNLNLWAILINLSLFLFMAFKAGTPGNNRYGAPMEDSKNHKIAALGCCVILSGLTFIVRPVPINSLTGNLALSVRQFNLEKPAARDFVTLDAYVLWQKRQECPCPEGSTCSPCTEELMILSDLAQEDQPVEELYTLLDGPSKKRYFSNRSGRRGVSYRQAENSGYWKISYKGNRTVPEYLLLLDGPKQLETGKKYRFRFYVESEGFRSPKRYIFSKQITPLG